MVKSIIYQPINHFDYLDLKKESFFNTINWDNLVNTPAPFIPIPDNDSDTFYFEGRFEFLIQ
jgi:hypothetical protein